MSQDLDSYRKLPPPAPSSPDGAIADLGDGLVLRHAVREDTEALAAFNRLVHGNPPDFGPAEGVAHWTRGLLEGRHPRVAAHDFLLVHDTRNDLVASSLNLISHRLRYGCVELEAGQPELVGTHPEYRRRGLVRRMFDVLHAESAQRGQQLLLIEGIPWYYRQFGYEMALELPAARQCDVDQLPDPPAGDGAFRVRPAERRDLAVVAKLYEQRCAQSRLSCVRDETLWRYELDGRGPECEGYRALSIVESPAGEPVAALAAMDSLRQGLFVVNFCELAAGVPGQKLARHLLGELRRLGEERAARDGGDFKGVVLALGREHPLYELARARLREGPAPYAFYVRVPDLAGFLRTTAPELERRLASSAFAGHTGAVDVSLYRSGLRLIFEGGRLERVEEWTPDTATRGDLAFPDLTFLQLLTGHRSLAELEDFLPDCLVWNENRGALIDALFPPEPSNLWPVL